MEFKPGMTAIIGSQTHSVKNIGKTTLKAILVGGEPSQHRGWRPLMQV